MVTDPLSIALSAWGVLAWPSVHAECWGPCWLPFLKATLSQDGRGHGTRQPLWILGGLTNVRGTFPIGSHRLPVQGPLVPLGTQGASGKRQELPKHLVTLLILLINAQ